MKKHLLPVSALLGGLLFLSSCQKEESAVGNVPNEGQQRVMDSIQAHGGAEKWYENGPLKFRWVYHMSDKGPEAVVNTLQTVDPKTMNVVHEVADSNIRFGIKDGQYWISPADAEFTPPAKFWALTPFYFIGIPFVFNDPNARFEKLDEKITFEGKDYDQVKVTYTSEAGDSPDDWYVLAIDPETKLTRGAYYIVTHPLVAPDGPGPAKFISLDGLTDVSGVQLASGHRTFQMEDGKIGDQMRFTEVSEVGFVPEESVDFSIPEGSGKL